MSLPVENQRIKDVINYFCNGNELQFSGQIGVSQPRINRLFNRDARSNKYPTPSFEIVQSIINTFINISAEWLIVGKGEMLKKELIIDTPNPLRDQLINRQDQLIASYEEKIEDLKNKNEELIIENENLKKAQKDITNYGMVAESQQKLSKK